MQWQWSYNTYRKAGSRILYVSHYSIFSGSISGKGISNRNSRLNVATYLTWTLMLLFAPVNTFLQVVLIPCDTHFDSVNSTRLVVNRSWAGMSINWMLSFNLSNRSALAWIWIFLVKTSSRVCHGCHSAFLVLRWCPPLRNYFMLSRFVCISINRLTLHLRSYTHDSDSYEDAEPSKSLAFVAKRPRRSSWLGASTLDVRDIPNEDETDTFEMRDGQECRSHHLDYDDASWILHIGNPCSPS